MLCPIVALLSDSVQTPGDQGSLGQPRCLMKWRQICIALKNWHTFAKLLRALTESGRVGLGWVGWLMAGRRSSWSLVRLGQLLQFTSIS